MPTSNRNKTSRICKVITKIQKVLRWNTRKLEKDPVNFELKEDAKQICSRTYPVPKVHGEMFKKEVEILFLIGVIDLANKSQWKVLYFPQNTPKSIQVRFLSDFRNLNKQLNVNNIQCLRLMACYWNWKFFSMILHLI